MKGNNIEINPDLDLVLERIVDVAPDKVWAAWTRPEHLIHWFTPAPWKTIECDIDLRPGGVFRTVMQSPEGENFPNSGCYLEVIENQKLVWTDALGPGYRPSSKGYLSDEGFYVTVFLLLEPHGPGTKYTAISKQGDPISKINHEKMGFYDGWGKSLDQMIEYIKSKNL